MGKKKAKKPVSRKAIFISRDGLCPDDYKFWSKLPSPDREGDFYPFDQKKDVKFLTEASCGVVGGELGILIKPGTVCKFVRVAIKSK